VVSVNLLKNFLYSIWPEQAQSLKSTSQGIILKNPILFDNRWAN